MISPSRIYLKLADFQVKIAIFGGVGCGVGVPEFFLLHRIEYNENVICIEYNANNVYIEYMHSMYCI